MTDDPGDVTAADDFEPYPDAGTVPVNAYAAFMAELKRAEAMGLVRPLPNYIVVTSDDPAVRAAAARLIAARVADEPVIVAPPE